MKKDMIIQICGAAALIVLTVEVILWHAFWLV